MRYVECNPLRAGLVKKAGDWPWSSLAIRTGKADKPITLCDSPVQLPKQWHRMVNNLSAMDETIAAKIEKSIERGSPLGDDVWIVKAGGELGLESTIRPRGRPRKY